MGGDNRFIHLLADTDQSTALVDMNLNFGFAALPTEVIMLLIIFSVLFVIGLVGNVSVIVLIGRTYCQASATNGALVHHRQLLHFYMYVLALAFVDLLVVLMIPLMLPYLYTGQWLVGAALCKIFWIVENVNKILSMLLLSVMAFERYLNVCYPLRCRLFFQPHKYYVFIVLTAIVAFTALLLAPILSYVQLDVLEYNGKQLKSCVTPIPDQLLVAFICYMLLFGYVCPAIVIVFCYTRLVQYIRQRFRKRANSNTTTTGSAKNGTSKVVTTSGTINRVQNLAVHEVGKSLLRVTIFHFACWTPFWISVLLPLAIDTTNIARYQRPLMTTRLFLTALPYVNSSFNWLFYAFLNKDLREQMLSRTSRADRESMTAAGIINQHHSTTVAAAAADLHKPSSEFHSLSAAIYTGTELSSPHNHNI